MSKPSEPAPVQPVVSVFGRDWDAFWPGLLREMEEVLGPAEDVTEPFPFTETDYYDNELGTPIHRRIIAFEGLIDPLRLVDIKLAFNDLEAEYLREDGTRRVNIDSGILSLERLVLATGKEFGHRIYLGRGIWADLTLLFQRGGWRTLPWTYPDYAGERVQSILTRVRSAYKAKLRAR
ncbi:MAG: DUF4416 family protein [Desulfohalobiaceae bacterium]